MKVALAQINTTVGDLAGNEAKIVAACQRAIAGGARPGLVPRLLPIPIGMNEPGDRVPDTEDRPLTEARGQVVRRKVTAPTSILGRIATPVSSAGSGYRCSNRSLACRRVGVSPKICTQVCNAGYGFNGWLGLAYRSDSLGRVPLRWNFPQKLVHGID